MTLKLARIATQARHHLTQGAKHLRKFLGANNYDSYDSNNEKLTAAKAKIEHAPRRLS